MPNVQNLLQAQGRTFTNAFNVYPFCSPSRATIQRGQYAHNHGIFGNGPGDTRDHGGYPAFDALDREKSTVATWLDATGYRTIHMGKYMNNFTSQDANPPGWDVFGTPTVPSQVGETKTATTANRAMAQLREDAKTGPFFLQVSFQAPHVPNGYESQDAAKFVGELVPRVPSYDEQDVADKPRYIREDKPPLSQQTDPEVDALCQDNEVNDGDGASFTRMPSIPSTSQGSPDSVAPIDYDGNGLTDFLVLNGGGDAGGPAGPVELIAFFPATTS